MEIVYLHGFAVGPGIWQELPAGSAPELCFEDLAVEARRVAEMLPPQSCLVGWSMGGMLAVKAALLAPDKVARLVLISTTPKFLAAADYPAGLSPALLARLTKKIKREGLGAFYELVFKEKKPVAPLDLPPDSAAHELAALAAVDLREEISELRLPTLVVHGDQDEICLPAAAEFTAKNIPESRLAWLKGVGHVPQLEAKTELAGLIADFAHG
ncbi:MAG: alpha/beta fold hydrolase [Candidatus Margulisiibacteriota bacterium]|jgi:pimeloyl-[acyl-carrier protein] methyl ester esterase